MPSSKDPWDWKVDEIVKFLCHDEPGDWSYNLACPDLVVLEISLRENSVSGLMFLAITNDDVKDLGIKVIAQRHYILKASKWLQRRSPKYQLDQQQQQQPPLNPPKALLNEERLSPKHIDDPTDASPLVNAPVNPSTSLDGSSNPTPLLDTFSQAQIEEKKPRRMETTIIERQPTSSLLETHSSHSLPAPNSSFGNDDFFDHLVKSYPPNDADVLSLLGDSTSDSEYDTETREEMEEDEGQSYPGTPPDASENLGDAKFNDIVDEYINLLRTQFLEIRLPKEQPKAFQIWIRGQKFPSMKSQISTRVAHLEKRCQALRKALAEAQHSSRSSLLQACACLDPTVVDICLDQWKLSVLEQTTPPAKVARPPRAPRPERPKVNSDGEETLSSDSDSVHDTGEEEDDESSDDSEDSLALALMSDIEEGEIAQHKEEPRPRAAYQHGPFHDSSSDEDLGHLFFKEENYEPPAAKRRRLKENSAPQDTPTSPLMPMTMLPLDRDVALPSKEGEVEGQMEENTHPVNPMRLNTHEFVDLTSDNGSGTDEALCVFDDVYSMMWRTIEESGNRLHLVAKALTGLPKNRIDGLSTFLGSYMSCLYLDYARDALKHMSDDSSVIEGMHPEESHSAMLMTALFVSWINVTQVPYGAFTAKEVKAALAAVREDLEEDHFTPFFNCLNDLLKGYKRWVTLSSRVQSNEPNPGKRKLTDAKIILTGAQKEGQERHHKQAKAKRALLASRFAQGQAHEENKSIPRPVSFQIPMICLDPYIAQYVKSYQLSGIQFMFREIIENKREEGCLLAHTMGLGKTMQVISLLVTISNAGVSQDLSIRDQIPEQLRKSKTLLLCPASLIQNWCDEFEMWTPPNHNLGKVRSITVKTPTLDRTKEICEWNDEGGILILSYHIFRDLVKDKAEKNKDGAQRSVNENVKNLVLNSPTLVVVDEAQNIRNHESQIAEAASRLRTRKRIALTGTPISNGLEDYYWMVDWVAPQYLGDFADFNDQFIKPIENGSQIESTKFDRREALQRQELFLRIIAPKVQRADTSVLASDLPPKYEFSVYFEPTNLQKAVYNILIQGVALKTEAGVRQELMSWLPLLKLCCNHPALFKAELESRRTKHASSKQKSPSSDLPGANIGFNMPVEQQIIPRSMLSELDDVFKEVPNLLDPSLSSRVVILNEILNQAITVGDKILVFSTSIPTLRYLAEVMDATQRKYSLLHGNVPAAQRPEVVRRFNNDPSTSVFLISTKAGGLGLNIQSANRVVIFDFQFNPTWEQQAIGRAYRIGQEKKVFVYRMVAAGTVEEKIYSKTIFKSQLAGRVLDNERVARMGSKALQQCLAPWKESDHKGGIHETAFATDPQMMGRLRAVCGKSIVNAKLCIEEIDPEDRLTDQEKQSVEDQLRLRRLHLESLGL
ncbi:Helicase, C-terminal [Penicillium expansum]|uniref:Helicase, C-terminal n=1 Tax=Penicillium expansum TaxID=27334 RepID=A0A0A2JUZ2_PENEN|nr:Helicase, C-terminal [Penicillium expansum]KGO58488.1 Helicase, C-terminal [Penicillium expansum]